MKKFQYNFLIFIICILTQLYDINCNRCGTDDLKWTKRLDVNLRDDKRKLSEDYKPIRIHIDYTALERRRNDYKGDIDILKEVFSSAAQDYEGILKVIRLNKYVITNKTPLQIS